MTLNPNTPTTNAEETQVQSHLLRVGLASEDSRAYWANADPAADPARQRVTAFENRWFGSKSMERVTLLLTRFAARYDAFPEAFEVMRNWQRMDPQTRDLICHWHLQLSDPLYREFSGAFLVLRHNGRHPAVDRHAVVRWIDEKTAGRWQAATRDRIASNMLSAALEVGLIQSRRDPRMLVYPKVTDLALGYLLYLLRGVRYKGSSIDNPYLASVGLSDDLLDQQVRAVPGVELLHMSGHVEFEWRYPNLLAWAKEVL
ncbi:MAG: DUF1819 family protein [Deltaproteobacteria bacterium]|nr:DUF1819 family protein [Deltaproteobacteria bacterium]